MNTMLLPSPCIPCHVLPPILHKSSLCSCRPRLVPPRLHQRIVLLRVPPILTSSVYCWPLIVGVSADTEDHPANIHQSSSTSRAPFLPVRAPKCTASPAVCHVSFFRLPIAYVATHMAGPYIQFHSGIRSGYRLFPLA